MRVITVIHLAMPRILFIAEYFKNCSEISVSNPLEKMILYFKLFRSCDQQ